MSDRHVGMGSSALHELEDSRLAPFTRRSFVAAAATGAVTLSLTEEAHAESILGNLARVFAEEEPVEGAAAAPQTDRPLFLGELPADPELPAPSVRWYDVAPDFSNVINVADSYLSELQLSTILANGFLVMCDTSDEFFGTYESNRYELFPNFVTVDSMVHTYHLYFSHLLRTVERGRLVSMLLELSRGMRQISNMQLEAARGTAFEQAALRNLGFFWVGELLCAQGDGSANVIAAEVPGELAGVVFPEYDLVNAATGISTSPLLGKDEDYSQYIPRGYYAGDPMLQAYFHAMMWYGRMNFSQDDEDLDRSALLMTLAMADEESGATVSSIWETVYQVTAFFAGSSDDNGYYEYLPLVERAFGAGTTLEDVLSDEAGWQEFHRLTEQLPAPKISSIPVADEGGEGEADHLAQGKGFRLMGQRFSLDAAIFTQLVYNRVGSNSAGANRMLPDALDVPAALGSEAAAELLAQAGAFDYLGYGENLEELRAAIEAAPDTLWSASLYSRWLHMLRPLAEPRGEGYPPFMQGWSWTLKNLQTFLGSYAELKHDTVLYSKQVMAEMGGGPIEERDDRGYVEPEPVIFARLSSLVQATAAGLSSRGLLGEEDAYNLSLLGELSSRLQQIAEKELRNEVPSKEEFELIRSFGGQLEHFWQEVYKHEAADSYFTTREFPAAVVTDVATDPNGRVLQLGTGRASTIYVVVPVEGVLRIASGSVFSFYQFEQPLDQRMTDKRWRQELGIQALDDGSYLWESAYRPVAWTDAFSLSWQDLY